MKPLKPEVPKGTSIETIREFSKPQSMPLKANVLFVDFKTRELIYVSDGASKVVVSEVIKQFRGSK